MRSTPKLRQMAKVLRLMHSLSKGVLPLCALSRFLKALLPFYTMVLSSLLLDRLAARTSLRELAFYAGLTVAGSALLSLLSSGAEKLLQMEMYTFSRHYRSLFLKKNIEMDYALIEDPKTHQLRAQIEEDEKSYGSWWTLFDLIGGILSGFFGILFSVAVAGQLLFAAGSGTGFFSSHWFTLVFLLLVAGFLLLSFPVDHRFLKKIYRQLDAFSGGNRIFMHISTVAGNYKNGKDIRVYRLSGMLDRESRSFWEEKGRPGFRKLSFLDGTMKGVKAALGVLMSGVVYLFVALKAVYGVLSPGEIVRFAGAVNRLAESFSQLVNAFHTFSITCMRLQNLFTYLELPSTMRSGTLPVEKRDDCEYEFQFHKVSFRYPGSDAWALRELSMKLRVGERLAVVGMNGSGKTTMIKLLCRLYDPTEGFITLNGIDIRKYDADEYRSLFSVVFQDFRLYAFSLGQNVAASMGFNAPRAEEALREAGFQMRLSSMPKGLDIPLYREFEDDGVEISGGEAQKIALARALYKDAPFIILDEPTSALDPVAEFEVYEKFNQIVGQKTAVYISHRLSSCRFCDDIAVFDEGRLIQRGSHQALLSNQNGRYYELWNAQARYYR